MKHSNKKWFCLKFFYSVPLLLYGCSLTVALRLWLGCVHVCQKIKFYASWPIVSINKILLKIRQGYIFWHAWAQPEEKNLENLHQTWKLKKNKTKFFFNSRKMVIFLPRLVKGGNTLYTKIGFYEKYIENWHFSLVFDEIFFQ